MTHDPNNTGRLYFGTFRVYLTTDFAGSWTSISPDLTGGPFSSITAIEVAPSDSNVVYVGTGSSGSGGSGPSTIRKTTNALSGAPTWFNVTTPVPQRNVTAIAVDRNNPSLVYVTYSGFSGFFGDTSGHVFRSLDGGATWQDISGTGMTALPNIPANDIVADPDLANTLYVATDVGVFTTADASLGNPVWTPLGTSLPRVIVLSLKGRARSRILRAATSGRSTWIIQLTNLPTPPGPLLTSIRPASALVGSPTITLSPIDGAQFTAGSTVRWRVGATTTPLTTTLVSPNQLSATVPASLLTQATVADIFVTDGLNTSKNLRFVVTNPAPNPMRASPDSVTAGGPSFTLNVTGANFVCGASPTAGLFNRVSHAPNPATCTSTNLDFPIAASEIAVGAFVPIQLFTPTPGGGLSGIAIFTINNPLPTLTSISPSSGLLNTPVTLTLTGSGYNASSIVNFGSNTNTGGIVTNNGNTLTITIPAFQLSIPGPVNVSVTNPGPGGGPSAPQTFMILGGNPVPTITPPLVPASATAGGPQFTLTVNGTNFVNGGTPATSSVVNFGGLTKVTTFVSATQLTATILAGDIAVGGTFAVTVTNPAPGGGTSNRIDFTVNNPVPSITNLNPSTIAAGGPAFTLTVNGNNFVPTSKVLWNGSDRGTTFVSATQLTAAIPASDIMNPNPNISITVSNPAPGGGASGAIVFVITQGNNPVPTINANGLSPSPATTGSAFTLTVNGTNFVGNSVVRVNGNDRATMSVSSTQITASIPAGDVPNAAAGPLSITVFNPAPGGGTSNAVNLLLMNPAPAITSLSPSNTLAGGAQFTLTVNGTGFVQGGAQGSMVNVGGSMRATTFVSGAQLTAVILASDIATAGTFNVTVTNPSPGGGTSPPSVFTVNNPVPTLASIAPNSRDAGSGAFTLTANGTNYNSSSALQFNGNPRATTLVSSTQVAAAILASDVAATGMFPVVVVNPGPGGGTSAPQTFTVTGPGITSLVPSSAAAGGPAFTLTVNGTNFVSGATVTWNGGERVTTFVSATQLTAAIPATDLAVPAGTAAVRVRNPAGALSNTVNFTINAPAITSLSPSTAVAGGPGFTLTVNGSNFVNGSSISFNNVAHATTFVSSASLTADIPAAEIATAGNRPVAVTNPGGATSNTVNFAVNNPAPAITPPLVPASATAGGSQFTLTVNGTNFVKGDTPATSSVVNFGAGNPKATTVVSATQLTATILASDIATAGTRAVTVTNPAPGGGTSNAVNFTINNPLPTLTSISPTSKEAGAAVTLTVNGTGFVNGGTPPTSSQVSFGSRAEPTTFVSSTQLTATIPASDTATGGPQQVTVTNPPPGGGTSTSSSTFTVRDYAVSGPTGAPPTINAGQSAMFTITVSPQGGSFGQPVMLTASGLPPASSASFSQNPVTPGESSANSTLTITTTARSAMGSGAPFDQPAPRPPVLYWLVAAMLALLSFALLREAVHTRRYAAYLPLTLLILGLAWVVGCGGGPSPPQGTPPGPYTITVTATSGTATRTTTVMLTVN